MTNSINDAVRSGKYMQRIARYDDKQSERKTEKIAKNIVHSYSPTASVAQEGIDGARQQLAIIGDSDPDYKYALEARIEREQRIIDAAARDARIAAEYAAKTEYENNVSRYESEGYSTQEAEHMAGKKEDCTIF